MKRNGNPSGNKIKMERSGVLSEPQLKTEKSRMSNLTQLNELQMERIRTFPFRPAPEPDSLTDFIEKAGTNRFLIEAVKKLYQVPNKPENPIEWFRLYFISILSESIKEGEEAAEDLNEVEEAFKAELIEIESKILNAFEVEAQNQAIIVKLEAEVKHAGIGISSANHREYEDIRKYRNNSEDYHYRIKPDPSYQPSRSDMMLSDNGDFRMRASYYDYFPFNRQMMFDGYATGSKTDSKKKVEENAFEDYADLYFPSAERTVSEPLQIDDEKSEEGETEKGLESEMGEVEDGSNASEGEEDSLEAKLDDSENNNI